MIDITTICKEFNYPKKVEALLHYLCLQGEDENDYDIEYPYFKDSNRIKINETVYYIFDDIDAQEFVAAWEEEIQIELEQQIPEYIRGYINWEAYWEDAEIQLDEATGCEIDSIKYLDEWYYYGDSDY